MAEPAEELPPLPPVVAEPPANPEPPANSDPPEEPLAEPAAQPATANQVISSFWCISFVLSFSYPFVRVSCFFSDNWVIWFSCKFLVPCLAYSAFHVSLGHIFVFLFASSWLRCGTARLQSRFCYGTNCFLYTVRDHSAPGARFCLKTSIGVCGPGPFGSGILFFVWKEFFVGSSQGAGFFFCLEWNIIVCGLGPLCSGTLYWSYIRSGTVSP